MCQTPGTGAWIRELSIEPAQFSGNGVPVLTSVMISQSGLAIGSMAAYWTIARLVAFG